MTIPRLNNNSNTFRINDFKDSCGDLLCQSFLELMIIQRVSGKEESLTCNRFANISAILGNLLSPKILSLGI